MHGVVASASDRETRRETLMRPEFRLLLACARTEIRRENVGEIEALMRAGVDWDAVLQQAAWHHVSALLLRALAAVSLDYIPLQSYATLKLSVERQRARTRVMLDELLRLIPALGAQGLDVIPFKGATLAHELYGDPEIRISADIDILIRPEDVAQALDVLAAHGYRVRRTLSARQEQAFRAYEGVYNIERDDQQMVIEAHWRIAQSVFGIDIDHDGLFKRAHSMRLRGRTVRTLSRNDLPLVLCVHGAKDQWTRLKWIVDVAELLRRHHDLDWHDVCERAREQDCERIVVHGLMLAHRLLDAPVPDLVAERFASDVTARWMHTQIVEGIETQRETPDRFKLNRYWLRMHDRRRNRLAYLRRTLLRPRLLHFQMITLPDRMFWGYYVVRFVHDYVLLPGWLVAKRFVRHFTRSTSAPQRS